MKMLHEDILNLCRDADNILWSSYHQGDLVKLIFPQCFKKQEGEIRVSEQEARFSFIEALCKTDLMYSVETPTVKSYQFTGNKGRAARTDTTVYNNHREKLYNIEFKAKGIDSTEEKHLPIYKDMQKLLREPVAGVWFHLLESADNSTINNLLNTLKKQIELLFRDYSDTESPNLILHISVLKHKFSIQKNIDFPVDVDNLSEKMRINLKVSRTELTEVIGLNGWNLNKL